MAREDRHPRQRLAPEARREAILAAGAAAFAAAPFDRVTVAAVAAAANASEALAHRYFDGKAGLYTEVVRRQLERLAADRHAVVAVLPPGTSDRDTVRRIVEAHLDHVAGNPGWAAPYLAAPSEPEAARGLRREHREALAADLASLLGRGHERRVRFAIVGFLGFLDAASADWAGRGCPADDRPSLVTAALDALQGALGDWGR